MEVPGVNVQDWIQCLDVMASVLLDCVGNPEYDDWEVTGEPEFECDGSVFAGGLDGACSPDGIIVGRRSLSLGLSEPLDRTCESNSSKQCFTGFQCKKPRVQVVSQELLRLSRDSAESVFTQPVLMVCVLPA
ncbi:hypothetical protein IRJ41_009185 [Triplophysa rosa]|uniref:Uncharacterized protein n=1 Tax=Triplophysa rosa TaxID=992332 RepID=A0A9W8CA97_TRIRA|nr:hypothetical protein IRJ41_009185 [Triplophysa rosa]